MQLHFAHAIAIADAPLPVTNPVLFGIVACSDDFNHSRRAVKKERTKDRCAL